MRTAEEWSWKYDQADADLAAYVRAIQRDALEAAAKCCLDELAVIESDEDPEEHDAYATAAGLCAQIRALIPSGASPKGEKGLTNEP